MLHVGPPVAQPINYASRIRDAEGHSCHMPTTRQIKTDVLVVGAGPVGLSLAGDLGWRGIGTILVERGDGTIDQPKMDGVGIRTMEICRRWGIVHDIETSDYNRDYPQDNVYLTTLAGYELGRQPFPPMRLDKAPSDSPQKRERCPQNMFDPILRRFATRQGAVTLLYKTRLLDLREEQDHVLVTVQDLATSEFFEIACSFLVGCDGGRSTVRQRLEIGMQGRGLLTHTTNIIFRCPDFNSRHNKDPGYRYMFVGEDGIWATIVAINGADQWRMSVIGNRAENPEYSEAELKAFAWKAMGNEFPLEILSVLRWARTELVADSYGRGRVYIAGDACHLTSPTGGLGMNTGIGDAVDLSWKLAARLEGWGGRELLAAYEIERRPIGKRITEFSTGNLTVMQSIPYGSELNAEGIRGERARSAVGEALKTGLHREWFSKNMHLGNRYTGSPICIYEDDEDDAVSLVDFNNPLDYRPSTRAGARAPHIWVDAVTSTLDWFGCGYVVVASETDASEALRLVEAGRRRAVPIVAKLHSNHAVVAAYRRKYVLVRPDGHVAWRGNTIQNADEIMRIVSGH